MLLYVCPECGRWSDVSVGKFLTDSWNNAVKNMPTAQIEQLGYPCPAGHGLMSQVQQHDRIFVRPGVVEQAALKEGGDECCLSNIISFL